MPKSYTDDLTALLRETLLLSRSKLDEYVEHEKAQCDVIVEQSRQEILESQRRIDNTVTHLLALQLQDGLTVNENNKQEIQMQQKAIQQEMKQLKKQLDEKQDRIKGKTGTLYSFLTSSFSQSKFNRITFGKCASEISGRGSSRTQTTCRTFQVYDSR